MDASQEAPPVRPSSEMPMRKLTTGLLATLRPSRRTVTADEAANTSSRWWVTNTTLTPWPAFLGLAVLFSLLELVLRKWKGVIASRFTS